MVNSNFHITSLVCCYNAYDTAILCSDTVILYSDAAIPHSDTAIVHYDTAMRHSIYV